MSGGTVGGGLGPRADMVKQETPLGERIGATLGRLRPGQPALVDAAGSVLLVAFALVGFQTTFWGWAWTVPAALGILLGLACAHVGATFRWPAALTALLVVACYFVLGGPIAARGDLAVGAFPTGATFHDLALVPVVGWKQMLTTVPPLDSRGALLLLPFLIGLVGTALTHGVARRFRPAGAALAAPLLLLGLSIALGTLVPASLLVQGVGFALAATVWASLRAHRNRPPLQNGAGRTTRFATATALLAVAGLSGWFVGPVLPGHAADSRAVWRTGMKPPFDVSKFPSPLAGYRKYTEPNPAQLYDRPLLTVQGLPDGVPLRFATLTSYDGSVWGAAQPELLGDPGAGFRRVGSHIANRAPGEEVTATVTVPQDGYSGVWVPTAGAVTGIDFTGPRADTLADQLRFNTDTGTGVLPDELQPGSSYRLTFHRPPAPPEDLPEQLPTATGSLVDTGSLTFLDTALDRLGREAPDPWQQLRTVAHTMRDEGAYTDGDPTSYERSYLPGHSLGRLERFLAASQLAGDDEQYAATLALVASRLDIPARVVLGALPSGDVVKGKDVHAWVEVQRPDGSWLTILPSEFVPKHNKKPKQQQQRTEQKRIGALVPPPASNNPPSVLQGPDQAQNDTQVRKKKDDNKLNPANWPAWLRILVLYVALPLLVLLLLYAGLLAWKARRRGRRRHQGPASVRLSGGWATLLEAARELRIPVTRRATRYEQPRALVRVVPAARVLAGGADRFVFGPDEATDEDIDAYWHQVEQERSRLRGRASWWACRRADLTLRTERWQDRFDQRHTREPVRGHGPGSTGDGRPVRPPRTTGGRRPEDPTREQVPTS
jgi:hypothetical protein